MNNDSSLSIVVSFDFDFDIDIDFVSLFVTLNVKVVIENSRRFCTLCICTPPKPLLTFPKWPFNLPV